tara:strand:+ start:1334 stop:1693 length:360 start_codon:yes stop_codon:yes gene_type:complete
VLRSILFGSCILFLASSALGPSESLAAGDAAATYKTYCSSCHGETGKGDGAASAALDPKPANFADAAFWKGKDDAYLTKVIKEGGTAVGKSPLMAAWGAVLKDDQIAGIVALMKTFKGK